MQYSLTNNILSNVNIFRQCFLCHNDISRPNDKRNLCNNAMFDMSDILDNVTDLQTVTLILRQFHILSNCTATVMHNEVAHNSPILHNFALYEFCAVTMRYGYDRDNTRSVQFGEMRVGGVNLT